MPPVSSDSVQIWLSKLRAPTTLAPLGRIVALLWSIWKTRNSAVFRNELPQSVATLIRAKTASAEWRIRYKLTQSIQPPIPPLPTPNPKQTFWIAWKKSPEGFIKVNFNGSKSSRARSRRVCCMQLEMSPYSSRSIQSRRSI